MNLSKLIAVGALALACLAFASPAVTAADVIDHSACGFDLVDPVPAFSQGDICALDLSADVVFIATLSPGDEDEAAAIGKCSARPAWAAITKHDGTIGTIGTIGTMRLPVCRPHDPGWRIS